MSKRSFSASFEFTSLKKICLELKQGVKRDREDGEEEDEDEPAVVKKQQLLNAQSGHKMIVEEMRDTNSRLRTEADEKDRLINYGMGEIRRLNAELLTSKHQLRMMEDYVAVMEGRDNDMPFYVS